MLAATAAVAFTSLPVDLDGDGVVGYTDLVLAVEERRVDTITDIIQSYGEEVETVSVPKGVRLDKALESRLHGGRIILLSDSYGLDNVDRLYQAMMRTWPFPNGLRAVQTGTRANANSFIQTVSPGNEATSPDSYQIDEDTGPSGQEPYEVTNAVTGGGSDGDGVYFTTPMNHILQVAFDGNYVAGAAGALVRVTLQNDLIEDGINGGLGTSSDDIFFRHLFYSPTSLNYDGTLHYHDSATGVGARHGTCSINAASRRFYQDDEGDPDAANGGVPENAVLNAAFISPEVDEAENGDVLSDTINSGDNNRRIQVLDSSRTADAIAAQSGNYLITAGWVARVGGKTDGVYLQHLGDESWSYEGYGTTSAPSYPGNFKRMTAVDRARYIDITTIEDQQEALIVVGLANEEGETQATYEGQMNDIVTQWDAAFTTAGQPLPHYLFWHMFNCSGTSDHETVGNAMAAVARANSRCHMISTYAITDGTLFEASASPAGDNWVEANGYGAGYTYGSTTPQWENGQANSFTSDGIHPDDELAADFFALVTADYMFNNIGSGGPRTRTRNGRVRGAGRVSRRP